MPALNILPAAPSFGGQLAQALGQAGTSVAQGLMQRRAMTSLQNLLTPQTTTNGQVGQAPIQQMMGGGSSGGPSLGNVLAVQQIAEQALGKEGGTTAMNYLLNQQKEQIKQQNAINLENIKRQSAISQKETETNLGQRDIRRKQRQEYGLALNAVEEGDVGGFDINWLAKILPGDVGAPLMTAKGVQLESAMKNALIDTLQKVTGQKNMWIEQQVRSATASIGKTKEANKTLIKSAMANLDIEDKLADTRDTLRSEYERAGVTPPSNLDQMVHDIVKPYANKVNEKLSYDLRRIYEEEKGPSSLNSLQKVPKGTPLTIERRDAWMKKFNGDKEKVRKMALKLGYTIPNPKNILETPQPEE